MRTAFYVWLVEVEDALVRMNQGVFRFITEAAWEWLYHFIIDTLGPVTIRLTRVAGLGCLWLFIVFGPLMVGVCFGLSWSWGFGCVTWAALSITGSIWGLRHVVRKRKTEVVQLREQR